MKATVTPKSKKLFYGLVGGMGEYFKFLRKQKGYTSATKFASDHDFCKASYQRAESGYHNLSILTIARLLEIHGLTIQQFLQGLAAHTKGK